MSKRATKFHASWSEKYAWISKDKNCIHSARCTLYSESFSIRNGGISDENQHSKTAIHVKNEKQTRSQRTLKTSASSLTGCSKPTTRDQIVNAEILQALNIVNKNHPFSSANGDSDRFKKMFPDSQIGVKYSQEEIKSKYVFQFGLAVFVKDELSTDVQKTLYPFKFDKTTTSQMKKQYDGCFSFFSKKLRKILTSYCGPLFVGHCTTDDLVDHFFEFVSDLGLDLNLLLALGIDGPYVNKSSKSKRDNAEKIWAHRFLTK